MHGDVSTSPLAVFSLLLLHGTAYMRRFMNHFSRRTSFVVTLVMTWQLGLAQGTKCPVGVNVNKFSKFQCRGPAGDCRAIEEIWRQLRAHLP
jgi:hypothetical protein